MLIVGAGYAARAFAGRLAARRVNVSLTVVAPERFVTERVRWHEAVAGRRILRHRRQGLFPRGAQHVEGLVTSIDIDQRRARVADRDVSWDVLVLATGSRDGLGQHVARGHADGGPRRVIGGGFTGVELAAELAGAGHPVALATSTLLPQIDTRSRAYVRRHLEDAGVRLTEGVRADPTPHDIDCRGFGVALPDGLLDHADRDGRVLVDRAFRLRSGAARGPGTALVVGDAARPPGPPLPMRCATALAMGCHAADQLAGSLAGRDAQPFSFRDTGACLSLGRRDGVVVLRDREGTPRLVATGWRAALAKEALVRMALHGPRVEARWRVPWYRWPGSPTPPLLAPARS